MMADMKEMIVVWSLLVLFVKGLSIDIDEMETSECLYPSVLIKCNSKTEELQAGSNKLMITHGGLTKASCDWDKGTCITASGYNASIEGTRAILTIKNMDIFYNSDAWACDVGTKTASLKLKYFRAEPQYLAAQLVSLRHITIVDLITLIIVIGILVVLIIRLCRTECCKRKQDSSKTDAESGSCFDCLFCCRKKEEAKPTGYRGKRYTVKESYNINDPNHVADAKFKDGSDRRTEAEKACKNVTGEKKEIIKENLKEYTEARLPLMSTTSEGDSKT